MTDRIGQQFGNYRLTRFLGEGGFAAVYLGEHIHLNTRVAIKILTTKLVSQDVEPFRHEAYLLAHLNHSNIVRVFDFGIEERERLPFLVMQYASHGTLRQQHTKGSIVPLPAILSYIKPVAAALQYAHSNRVIHRDVKPENMLIGDQNEILLSDFGIALLAQSTQLEKTQEFIGTVSYMSPEQIQGKPQAASDQYSLGIAVYEWLCGTYPFKGSFLEVCTQHMVAPLPPLRQSVPTISPEIEQVVTRALAKDPKDRFPSIQAFAMAFVEAAEGRTSSAYAPVTVNTSGIMERRTRDSVSGVRTPNLAEAGDSRARGSASFIPTSTTEQMRSRERQGGTRSSVREYVDPVKGTVGPQQEPVISKKAKKGLLVWIIAAVIVLILGSSGAFAAINISHREHALAAATAEAQFAKATTAAQAVAATTTAQSAKATAAAALLTANADFTVQTPKLSNMILVSNDSAFDTNHAVLNPGQQVVVAFTHQANTKSVFLTIRALVSQDGPNVAGFAPIDLFCNGQAVVSNYTMPGNGYDVNTTSIEIPAQQLTNANNQLRFVVVPNAKTLFWLYNLQVVQSV